MSIIPALTLPRLIGDLAALGAIATAVVSSYDSDGFTLTWTRVANGTGTATVYALCEK